METSTSTPTRPPHPAPAAAASRSPTPSPLSHRMWLTVAQRNLRNQWSRMVRARDDWLAAAEDGRSHAAALVNAHMNRRSVPGMDLGALKDMPGIRDKASAKLARREEQCCNMLLSAYEKKVLALSHMVEASRSIRCFAQVPANSAVEQYSVCQADLNDSGDGGGATISKWLSIAESESLAQELAEMFVLELKLKRLLILEFLSVTVKEGEEQQASLDWADELYDGESEVSRSIGLLSGGICLLPENWSAIFQGLGDLAMPHRMKCYRFI